MDICLIAQDDSGLFLLQDEEMFEGDKRYAENDLKKWIGTHGSTTRPTFPKGKVSP